MSPLPGLSSRLRPLHARGLLVAGLLVSLVPLSRRAPRTQRIQIELPRRFRDSRGRVDVSWTRAGDTEPLGGFTLTFPAGAPASLSREISVPDGKYRLDILVERLHAAPSAARGEAEAEPEPPTRASRIEIARQLSLNGARVRVLLEDTPP